MKIFIKILTIIAVIGVTLGVILPKWANHVKESSNKSDSLVIVDPTRSTVDSIKSIKDSIDAQRMRDETK